MQHAVWPALLIAALSFSVDVAAHALLVATQPADGSTLREAPSRVVLTFNEPVQTVDARVLNGEGKLRAAANPGGGHSVEVILDLPPALPAGGYLASFRVVSADGHPISGAITFAIGEGDSAWQATRPAQVESGAWNALISVNRAIYFAAVMIATGGALYLLVVALNLNTVRRSLRWLLLHAAWIAAACAVLAIGLQGGLLIESKPMDLFVSAAPWQQGMASSRGAASCIALAGLLCLILGVLAAGRMRSSLMLATGCVAILASFVFAGHAASATPRAAAVLAWLVHAGAAAFWIGSLAPLLMGLRGEPEASLAAVRRFSALALWIVAGLAIAGVVMAAIQVQRPEALIATDYGKVLMAKLALVTMMLSLAGINRFLLLPQMARSAPDARRKFAISLRLELALGVTILALAAMLTQQVPPSRLHAAASAGESDEQVIQDGKGRSARLRISRIDSANLHLTVNLNGQNGAVLEPQEVKVELSQPSMGVEPLLRGLKRIARGEYQYSGPDFVVSGQWQIRIVVLISDFEQAEFAAGVNIRR